MMHDFAITEHYALFPIFPTVVDHDVLRAGGEHWIHHQDWDSWLGVMPRYGDVSEVRWFKGPKGVHAYHMMNAFEDADGRIHLDQCMSSSNAFSFIREASGLNMPQQTLGGGLVRWTVDYDDPSAGVSEVPLGPPGDMPRVPDAVMGRPYSDSWYCSINPNGPPVFGGIVGVCFTLLFYRDNATGALMPLMLPPGQAINEPVHIPSRTPGHKGWLLAVVDEEGGPEGYEHSLWIIDGGNVPAGPVAKVKVPRRLRPQVHGWWVPKAELATG
jgi:carotenoid cleavage dioxygenase